VINLDEEEIILKPVVEEPPPITTDKNGTPFSFRERLMMKSSLARDYLDTLSTREDRDRQKSLAKAHKQRNHSQNKPYMMSAEQISTANKAKQIGSTDE